VRDGETARLEVLRASSSTRAAWRGRLRCMTTCQPPSSRDRGALSCSTARFFRRPRDNPAHRRRTRCSSFLARARAHVPPTPPAASITGGPPTMCFLPSHAARVSPHAGDR
jgi:hypothetical protein